MNKPMIMMATSVLASLALLHPPSVAGEDDNQPIITSSSNDKVNTGADPNPRIEFSIDQDVLNASILDDPIDKGIYRKPDAYEAERALLADHATLADHAVTATLADEATRAFNADVAIRVEEKLPYGQAWDFGLTQAQEGSRTFTQHYARPTGADAVLINANCITAGEKGDLSRVVVSFDGGFTRNISLCQSGRTSGTEEQSRGYNAVNLDVPRNATSLSITQYVEKGNNRGTAITDGFVQWFGPHSQVASATPPTDGEDVVTVPEPPEDAWRWPNPCDPLFGTEYDRCISGFWFEVQQNGGRPEATPELRYYLDLCGESGFTKSVKAPCQMSLILQDGSWLHISKATGGGKWVFAAKNDDLSNLNRHYRCHVEEPNGSGRTLGSTNNGPLRVFRVHRC